MDGEATPEIIELMGSVADAMLANLDQLVADMAAAELELTPALGADAALLAEMSASNRANAARLFRSLGRRDGHVSPLEVPPEALDVARTVARRGMDLDVIFQAYRRGQNVAWRHFMSHAARLAPSGPLLLDLLDISSQRIFEFVDYAIARVIAAAQREREEVLGGALARRIETVRMILDGAPITSRRASERLGYELSRRHTALVLWTEPSGEVQGALDSAATILARVAGARPPLTISAGISTLWAWLGTDSDPALDDLGEVASRVHPNVRIAVGPTCPGIGGFRRSHRGALDVQNLLAANADSTWLALYRDLEVTVLAAQDHGRAAEFVAATLGPLAAKTPEAAVLRQTLRVFLDEAENAPRTAARINTHRNTVLQRISRATKLLGYDPGQRRLAVQLALELAHELGSRVLTQT